jgi:hypothetical protein
MQKHLRLAVIGSISLALLVLIFNVAYAKSIVVDGIPNEWAPTEGVYTNPLPSAFGEAGITRIYVTNDPTYLYWRFDTISDTDWSEVGYFALCLNSDNNSGTGLGWGPCSAGTDYFVTLEPGWGTAEIWNTAVTETVPYTVAVATLGNTTELAFELAAIGINGTNCPVGCDIPTAFRMDATQVFVNSDGSVGAPADFEAVAPAAFTATPRVGFGSPSAVNLAEFNARVVNLRTFDWRIVAAVGVLIAGLVVVRRIKN